MSDYAIAWIHPTLLLCPLPASHSELQYFSSAFHPELEISPSVSLLPPWPSVEFRRLSSFVKKGLKKFLSIAVNVAVLLRISCSFTVRLSREVIGAASSSSKLFVSPSVSSSSPSASRLLPCAASATPNFPSIVDVEPPNTITCNPFKFGTYGFKVGQCWCTHSLKVTLMPNCTLWHNIHKKWVLWFNNGRSGQ
jgi:hypothetical protein